ncbi:protoheme IX farnesyltransferase, mitochondrial [Cinnamomum micranthum f. kanehirae]|uniref:Heme O synthase n=1 Tax=Cinnamomum micranthum f. kanehirae TaxID=337451 RepID=A0A3S3MHI9_9MAGN|nr:protoheme IX farnesyltransferase, mitochondrial [Cinnamomum micranthum f. kanehirae]
MEISSLHKEYSMSGENSVLVHFGTLGVSLPLSFHVHVPILSFPLLSLLTAVILVEEEEEEGGGILSVLFAPSSSSHLHSSSSGIPSPFDSLKSGLTKPLQSRPFILSSCSSSAAAAALSPSSSIAKAARDAADALQHYSRCYWELSKARLSLLVVATSGTGFVLGSGGVIDFAGLCFTCAGTMMVAASANSLNQVFEINNDAKMKRTMQRPLPSGRISVPHAIVWASSVGVAGTTLLAWKANALTAGLAASTLALYAFVYTPLKQIHPINTWVGAVVGAIPPLLG